MKARIPTEVERFNANRKRGVELIKKLRGEGFSDEEIARKLGVPLEMAPRFFKWVGADEPKEENKS